MLLRSPLRSALEQDAEHNARAHVNNLPMFNALDAAVKRCECDAHVRVCVLLSKC